MKLFTVKFPELDHLPAAERDRILRCCAESAEMRRFQKRLRFVGFIPVAIAFPLLFAALFRWHWSFLPAWLLFILVLCASAIAMFGSVIAARVRIYRRLVRSELQR
jgi:hypothetical protein